ncbi:SCO family protein [Emcibacter sp. SYSU 3D8]|uniref:SCO family protein n=1 Tax=Emcibacter sp. SYSU 3D8 TaxID=3133969 RepID=UPI0031FE7692
MRLLIPVAFALLLAGAVPLSGCGDSGCRGKGDAAVPIGGAFELADQTGRAVTDETLKGKYRVVYFGFTFCPDICPTELQAISGALDMLGEDADKFTPVFITIDPERDTQAVMGRYLKSFHLSFIGLTGTAEQIAKAAGAYRVFYSKDVPPDAPEAYMMNHSGYVYLMDCDGKYIRHFDAGSSAADMAKAMQELL